MKNNNWIYSYLELKDPKYGEGRRGKYVYFDPVKLERLYVSDINENDRVKKEFNLLLDGELNELMQWDIWENDDALLIEYIKLFKSFKKMLKENALKLETSRNICFSNAKCCLSYFQKVDNTLYVIARSSDLKALSWDLETCKYFANKLNCSYIDLTLLRPHYYLNKEIARRK